IKSEQCLYVRQSKKGPCYLLVWVDDILLFANDETQMEEIKNLMKQELEVRDLGPIGHFLGLNFEKSTQGNYYSLSQEMYIDELVQRFNLEDASRIRTLPQIDTLQLENATVDENVPVRNLLGCLLYIANMTRPDIAAAVNFLARHLHRPNRLVWKYGKHILAYLKHTKHHKLNIGHLDDSNLVCYVDANYATPGDRKAQSGAIFQFNGCSIGWFSKKQKTTSLSSTEAEYVALAAATKDVLWIQQLLNELTVPVRLPTVLYEDNLPAIQIANHQRNLSDTKHIDVK